MGKPVFRERETVVVTGATGQAGAALVPVLLEAGFRVLAVRREKSRPLNIESPHLHYRIGDLRYAPFAADIIPNSRHVIHLAGENTRSATLDEIRALDVSATAMLAEAAARYGCKTFIYLSCAAVYGPGQGAIREDAPVSRWSPWAQARIDAEQAALHAGGEEELRRVVVRTAHLYGGKAPLPEPLWSLVQRIAGARIPVPFFSGGAITHWIHCEDLAHALAAILRSDWRGVINAGDNVPARTGDLLNHVFNSLGVRRLPVPLGLDGLSPLSLARMLDDLAPGVRLSRRLGIAELEPWLRDQVLDCSALARLGFVPRHGAVTTEIQELLRPHRATDEASRSRRTGELHP
ncbi:MAG: hypothetical protein GMKNLPBB_00218 [Myxococcota bacterium]|nr:hypothetical protein [Myxococcota bacterium]